MGNPTEKERAEHILDAIRLIKKFVKEVDEAAFLKDVKIQSAVQYQFLIVGEVLKYMDPEILKKYDYPWHIPRSFRNFIIHVYHAIKMERIYYAANDLDELEKQVSLIVKNEFN